MTLASLANAPTDGNSMSEWTFAHSDLCLRTIDFLNGKDNKLIMQQMDPIATYDVQSALLRIQDVHNGINGVLGVSGFDLLDLNINDPNSVRSWTFNVFSEAQQWTAKTGIS
jgi:hypothetical protein